MKLLAILACIVLTACSTPQAPSNEPTNQDAVRDLIQFGHSGGYYETMLMESSRALVDEPVFSEFRVIIVPVNFLSGLKWHLSDGVEGCQYSNMTTGLINCESTGEACRIRIQMAADWAGTWFELTKDCDGWPIMDTVSINGVTHFRFRFKTWIPVPV